MITISGVAMAGAGQAGTGQGRSPSASPSAKRRTSARPTFTAVRIGVLSDSHGYLDPEVLTIFAGVDHIVHAGDVMDGEVLTALATVAPVTAVSGNLDTGKLAARLPRAATGDIGGVRFVVAHKPKRLLKRLAAGKITVGEQDTGPDLVVWGHLHTPTAAWIDGALHLNPGTASSPDEEDDDPTVAIVERTENGLAVRFVPLRRRPAEEAKDRL
jgi:putative phosphoesterase